MKNFCSNCGSELSKESNLCPNCGKNINEEKNNSTVIINNYNINNINLPKRNIAVCILLSLITCGIYAIYWFIVMTDESNIISEEKTASGLTAFIFTIITCGIYFLYWNFKMGEKLYYAGKKYNKPIGNNAVPYILLSILGLGFINYCLIQNDLNKFSK